MSTTTASDIHATVSSFLHTLPPLYILKLSVSLYLYYIAFEAVVRIIDILDIVRDRLPALGAVAVMLLVIFAVIAAVFAFAAIKIQDVRNMVRAAAVMCLGERFLSIELAGDKSKVEDMLAQMNKKEEELMSVHKYITTIAEEMAKKSEDEGKELEGLRLKVNGVRADLGLIERKQSNLARQYVTATVRSAAALAPKDKLSLKDVIRNEDSKRNTYRAPELRQTKSTRPTRFPLSKDLFTKHIEKESKPAIKEVKPTKKEVKSRVRYSEAATQTTTKKVNFYGTNSLNALEANSDAIPPASMWGERDMTRIHQRGNVREGSRAPLGDITDHILDREYSTFQIGSNVPQNQAFLSGIDSTRASSKNAVVQYTPHPLTENDINEFESYIGNNGKAAEVAILEDSIVSLAEDDPLNFNLSKRLLAEGKKNISFTPVGQGQSKNMMTTNLGEITPGTLEAFDPNAQRSSARSSASSEEGVPLDDYFDTIVGENPVDVRKDIALENSPDVASLQKIHIQNPYNTEIDIPITHPKAGLNIDSDNFAVSKYRTLEDILHSNRGTSATTKIHNPNPQSIEKMPSIPQYQLGASTTPLETPPPIEKIVPGRQAQEKFEKLRRSLMESQSVSPILLPESRRVYLQDIEDSPTRTITRKRKRPSFNLPPSPTPSKIRTSKALMENTAVSNTMANAIPNKITRETATKMRMERRGFDCGVGKENLPTPRLKYPLRTAPKWPGAASDRNLTMPTEKKHVFDDDKQQKARTSTPLGLGRGGGGGGERGERRVKKPGILKNKNTNYGGHDEYSRPSSLGKPPSPVNPPPQALLTTATAGKSYQNPPLPRPRQQGNPASTPKRPRSGILKNRNETPHHRREYANNTTTTYTTAEESFERTLARVMVASPIKKRQPLSVKSTNSKTRIIPDDLFKGLPRLGEEKLGLGRGKAAYEEKQVPGRLESKVRGILGVSPAPERAFKVVKSPIKRIAGYAGGSSPGKAGVGPLTGSRLADRMMEIHQRGNF